METLNVVSAIILQNNKILISKRKNGNLKDLWEFPGGKVKPYESNEDAIKREILEELELSISVNKYLSTTEHNYPNFHLSMSNYMCSINNGTPVLHDHTEIKWIKFDELNTINFAPADVKVAEDLKREFCNK